MRKIVRASMLVLALTVCTHAGEMGQPKAQPQSAPTTSTTQPTTEQATNGNMGNPAPDGNMGDPKAVTAAEVALSLLQSLLALF